MQQAVKLENQRLRSDLMKAREQINVLSIKNSELEEIILGLKLRIEQLQKENAAVKEQPHDEKPLFSPERIVTRPEPKPEPEENPTDQIDNKMWSYAFTGIPNHPDRVNKLIMQNPKYATHQSKNGSTFLHRLAEFPNAALKEYEMLFKLSDAKKKDNNQKTAIDVAREKNNRAFLKMCNL